MKLIKTAIDERVKQLTRKMNSEPNQMIKEIIQTEISELRKEEAALAAKK